MCQQTQRCRLADHHDYRIKHCTYACLHQHRCAVLLALPHVRISAAHPQQSARGGTCMPANKHGSSWCSLCTSWVPTHGMGTLRTPTAVMNCPKQRPRPQQQLLLVSPPHAACCAHRSWLIPSGQSSGPSKRKTWAGGGLKTCAHQMPSVMKEAIMHQPLRQLQ